MNVQTIQNFIGNKWLPPQSGQYLDNFNPATGLILSKIPDSDAADIGAAVQAARQAFPIWSAEPKEIRAQWLRKIADEIEKRRDQFAKMESLDQGKPVQLANAMDLSRAILNFRFFADEILRTQDDNFDETETHQFVVRKPVGVVGLISPWNLPLYLLTWKLAPALAAGNTAVCKPSEFTSMTAQLLCEVLLDIGLPTGVVNVVFGLGAKAGEALVQDSRVPLISFTGGTETGKRIYRESAENFKKLSLELGGKNPNLIFADADLNKAISGSVRAAFLNQGEICLCGSRIYVEEKIYPQFVESFVMETKKLKVGDPQNPETFMGPLVSKTHLEKVQSYIELAKTEGGQILCGGDRPSVPPSLNEGYFLNPTVITGLQQKARCIQEEIFGPVVTISSFRSEDEAVQLANDVRYGLSASLWTEDLAKADRVAKKLETGTVWINTWMMRDLRMPFGGVKHSGLGREGGKYSMEFFSELTTVCRKKAENA